jgi:hypothetical protein
MNGARGVVKGGAWVILRAGGRGAGGTPDAVTDMPGWFAPEFAFSFQGNNRTLTAPLSRLLGSLK